MWSKPAQRLLYEALHGSAPLCTSASESIRWVFLGPPGVGKGTYASRMAESLGIAHIAAGDLVRAEMKSDSERAQKMRAIVNTGQLLPDSIVLELLNSRLESGYRQGERGFILDGFPRTRSQAEQLTSITDIQLAVNLSLREDILVTKCLGRRMCSKCGKNFNIADINFPAQNGHPEVVMPPMPPPKGCEQHLEQRADDREDVIRKRLEVYHSEATPVEEFYRDAGLMLDFEITTGVKETLPRLKDVLQAYIPEAPLLQQATL